MSDVLCPVNDPSCEGGDDQCHDACEPPEPSIAFTAGQDARRMKIPLRRSALRKLRPGSKQYDDFVDGYEGPLRKRT